MDFKLKGYNVVSECPQPIKASNVTDLDGCKTLAKGPNAVILKVNAFNFNPETLGCALKVGVNHAQFF